MTDAKCSDTPPLKKKKLNDESTEKGSVLLEDSDGEMPPLIPMDNSKNMTSDAPLKKKTLTDEITEKDTILLEDSDDEMPPLIPMDNGKKMNSDDNSLPKKELIILSWNIDGLDEREIQLRSLLGIYESIRAHSPDIILLQEVVDENLAALQQLCSKYEFAVHKLAPYYNVILIKKEKAIKKGEKTHFIFKNSGMGRYLLTQELEINGIPFSIMTTHLESCANVADIRKEQLRICFEKMKSYMPKSNVILSGDLNIRESEIKSLGGPPKGISDAWIACGSDFKNKFTWDLQLNDNLSFGSVKPRARYDRMFYTSLKEKGIKCSSFDLVGKDRIEACGLFPSDHFGVLVKFIL